MKFLRADHQIKVRQSVEQTVAARLRHAAKKTEDNFRPPLREMTEHSHFPERLLLRHVPHAAGVQENDVSLAFGRGAFITAHEQRMRDLLRVALVHLTTVSFNEKFRHRDANSATRRPSAPRPSIAQSDGRAPSLPFGYPILLPLTLNNPVEFSAQRCGELLHTCHSSLLTFLA